MPLRFVGAPGSRSIERMARPAGLILDYGNVLTRAQDQTWMDGAARRLGAGALDAADLAWLIAADIASWSVYRDEVWALAALFRRTGGRTAFLSNSGPEVMARVRGDRSLEARFDAVVISCEVGFSKPDPRIYQLCLDRLGLAAPETLFVDDRADNFEGAARVGLQTLQFEGPDALERLRALIR